MILEGIVTTRNEDGSTNVAPMGPIVDGALVNRIVLQPYRTSQTYNNLERHPRGVFHVTDDVLLLAQATIGVATPPLVAAPGGVSRLEDCCRFAEFEIESLGEPGERARIECRVEPWCTVREFFGLNRAKFAIVEAAILASRVHLLNRTTIDSKLDELAVLVEKTGGEEEHEAFHLLRDYVSLHAKSED